MITWLLKGWASMKIWFVAAGAALAAIGAAFLIGRREQSVSDTANNKVADAQANDVVTETLTKIAATAQTEQAHVQTLPVTGPTSAVEQLHNDWSSDTPNDGP